MDSHCGSGTREWSRQSAFSVEKVGTVRTLRKCDHDDMSLAAAVVAKTGTLGWTSRSVSLWLFVYRVSMGARI